MKRINKIALGIFAIIFVFISSCIGFWILGDMRDTYSSVVRFVFQFFFTFTPVFTMLTVINLLKKEA